MEGQLPKRVAGIASKPRNRDHDGQPVRADRPVRTHHATQVSDTRETTCHSSGSLSTCPDICIHTVYRRPYSVVSCTSCDMRGVKNDAHKSRSRRGGPYGNSVSLSIMLKVANDDYDNENTQCLRRPEHTVQHLAESSLQRQPFQYHAVPTVPGNVVPCRSEIAAQNWRIPLRYGGGLGSFPPTLVSGGNIDIWLLIKPDATTVQRPSLRHSVVVDFPTKLKTQNEKTLPRLRGYRR